jgi:hypothetical protein
MAGETSRVAHGIRLRFEKQEEDLFVSTKMYSDGKKLVRVVVKPLSAVWYIIDAATGHVYLSGGEGINNYEVLLRHAKRNLIKFLNIPFKKETRRVNRNG